MNKDQQELIKEPSLSDPFDICVKDFLQSIQQFKCDILKRRARIQAVKSDIQDLKDDVEFVYKLFSVNQD